LSLYSDELGRLEVPFPPLAEQIEVVGLIDAETKDILKTVVCLEGQVRLLKEYRSRLINDLVTGKLDVREASLQIQAHAYETSLDENFDSELEAEELEADDNL
jgi:type I restriction enzyme S subunit